MAIWWAAKRPPNPQPTQGVIPVTLVSGRFRARQTMFFAPCTPCEVTQNFNWSPSHLAMTLFGSGR